MFDNTKYLEARVREWESRVAPLLEDLPEEERTPRVAFLGFLATSVERGDVAIAQVVQVAEEVARKAYEGSEVYYPVAPYNDKAQFENLFTLYEAGRNNQ